MLNDLSCIAAQDSATAQRFMALGADKNNVVVTGSVKFDIQPPEFLIKQAKQLNQDWQLQDRPVLVAASTHDPEEAQILAQFKTVLVQYPNAVLIVVRHPERFASVAQLIKNNGFDYFSVVSSKSFKQILRSIWPIAWVSCGYGMHWQIWHLWVGH